LLRALLRTAERALLRTAERALLRTAERALLRTADLALLRTADLALLRTALFTVSGAALEMGWALLTGARLAISDFFSIDILLVTGFSGSCSTWAHICAG
jgi:hypothetical protein